MYARVTLDDIIRHYRQEVVARARTYVRQGRVRKITVSDAGDVISGSVQGTESKPYTQMISVDEFKGRARLATSCSCPLGGGCKHVVAVLLQHLTNTPRVTPLVPAAASKLVPTAPILATPTSPTVAVSLSPAMTRWLDRTAAAGVQTDSGHAQSHGETRGIVYVLKLRTESSVGEGLRTVICPTFVRARRDGAIVEQRPYDPEGITRSPGQIPRFVLPEDIDVLRDCVWLKRAHMAAMPDIVLPPDRFGLRVLAAALATGRTRWIKFDGPVLAFGATVLAEPKWITADDGSQRLTFVPLVAATEPPQAFHAVLPLAPPHYVDPAQGRVGIIETAIPDALAAEVARAPAVSPQEAVLVRDAMQRRLVPRGASKTVGAEPQVLVPLPEAPDNVETRHIVPVPRLELAMAEARIKPQMSWYTTDPRHRGNFKIPIARLSFAYDTRIVAHADAAQCLQYMEGDKLILVPRDHQAEMRASELAHHHNLKPIKDSPLDLIKPLVGSLFMAPAGNQHVHELARNFDDAERYLAFSLHSVPRLQEKGWQIEFSADYPYRVAEGDVGWWADVEGGSGIDWFGFELGIEFAGERINLIPTLAAMIGDLPPAIIGQAHSDTTDTEWLAICDGLVIFHRLGDGRLLRLPGQRLAPILRALIQLVGPRADRMAGGKVKLHRADAAALSAFAGAAGADVDWAASAKRLIDLGDRLRGLATIAPRDVRVSEDFKASLRPYQLDGLVWLDFLRETGFGGALADDMGLGKTVQTLAFLTREKAEGRLTRPVLIVAPTSVMPNWKAEVERFAPALSILPLHGPDRAQHFKAIKKHDVILTTYPLLARDAGTFLKIDFYAAILDEAQAIKNPKATITGIAHSLKATHRFALTGTPLENNLGEVWSLFEFLAPGLLGDESAFRRNFRTPIEKHGDQAAQVFLSRRLKPFMLRRTKDLVAKELPPKTEIIEHVSLQGAQRDLYETVRALMDKKVRDAIDKKGLAKSHIVFLDALLKLRQVCCDPRLLKLPIARRVTSSAKLERLMEMIPEMVGNGRRILLFSQFTSMLDLIEEELRRAKITWVKIVGDTTDRETPVRDFQAGKVPLFLLSLKAGGTGLNLTAADTVIHYDPWWNPAVENQATDRAHRIGQTKPVFVHKLIVDEGIEQAIELLKARKAALADALFAGGSSAPLQLTEQDIQALLAPLSVAPDRMAA